jgi:hypothetical protein
MGLNCQDMAGQITFTTNVRFSSRYYLKSRRCLFMPFLIHDTEKVKVNLNGNSFNCPTRLCSISYEVL